MNRKTIERKMSRVRGVKNKSEISAEIIVCHSVKLDRQPANQSGVVLFFFLFFYAGVVI